MKVSLCLHPIQQLRNLNASPKHARRRPRRLCHMLHSRRKVSGSMSEEAHWLADVFREDN